MSNWADLPSELIQEIGGKHTNFVDYLHTQAVCTSWKSSLPKRPHNISSHLPFLLLPYYQDHPGHRGFYNISNDKTYSLKLPKASEKRCCGSSHGWLIMVEDTPSVFLLNPLTRAKIELPSLSTFPTFPTDLVYLNSRNLNENYIMREKLHIRDTFIVKAVLSADPSTTKDFIVAVIYGFNENLAYCKWNNTEWKIVDTPRRYKDILFREGKLHTVDQTGAISVFNEELNSMIRVSDLPPVNPRIGYRQWYIASCNEEKELLVIARYRKVVPGYEYKTERFEVYRLGEDGWRKMESLGEKMMLFLGTNSSLCISVNNCEGNCIYFSDDYVRLGKDYAWEGHDYGKFEMENGEIRSLGLRLSSSPMMKQPCFPHMFYFEQCIFRDTSVFVLPPPVWVTISP
ncbi:hypothetical protein M5689_024973 [Euphorbia peplus]|nr:hypothetical protein M5689_024973 [Euphorbia peplus]